MTEKLVLMPDMDTCKREKIDCVITQICIGGKIYSAGVLLDKGSGEYNVDQADMLYGSAIRRIERCYGLREEQSE